MREVDNSLDKISKNLNKAFQLGLRHAGKIIQTEIRRLINDPPKTGIKYRHLPNRSSAQGEAPATQSGNLMKGVKFKVTRSDLEVGDTVFYGGFLEFYHKRPHVSTAVSAKQATVNLVIQTYVNKEILA